MLRCRTLGLFLVIGMIAAVGCSPSTPTLRGKVMVDGQGPPPDLRGTISFEPVTPGSATAFANIAEDGSYEAKTGAGSGLTAGEYRVRMSTPIGIPPPNAPTSIPFWAPLTYNDYETSGLTVTIEAGPNVHDFELKSDFPGVAGG